MEFFGRKYGWGFRINAKKSVIIYLLSGDRFFKVDFVFGARAYYEIMNANIAEEIKTALKAATVYAEGRGISLHIKDKKTLNEIYRLIEIKLSV